MQNKNVGLGYAKTHLYLLFSSKAVNVATVLVQLHGPTVTKCTGEHGKFPSRPDELLVADEYQEPEGLSQISRSW